MAGRVLEPHFRHVPIEYDEYLGLKGPIKAVFSPWLVPIVAAGLAMGAFMALQRRWVLMLAGVAVALTSVIVGLWVAYYQREKCLDTVIKPKLDGVSKSSPEPHVIAHSFGTYLIGRALQKFPDVLVDRMVLVGSVLSCRYKWGNLLDTKPVPFTVRNETGKRDLVVKLAGLVSWVARDIGDAGLKGFTKTGGVVHDAKTVWGLCDECVDADEFVAVHNVPLDEFRHSTHFLSDGHARSLWLPYLWGYIPEEFYLYLRLCREGVQLMQERRWADLADVEQVLHEGIWTWTKGQSLSTYVKRSVEHYLSDPRRAALVRQPDPKIDEIVEEAIQLVYLAVVEATSEATKPERRDDNVIRALYPPIAIARAVELALDVAT